MSHSTPRVVNSKKFHSYFLKLEHNEKVKNNNVVDIAVKDKELLHPYRISIHSSTATNKDVRKREFFTLILYNISRNFVAIKTTAEKAEKCLRSYFGMLKSEEKKENSENSLEFMFKGDNIQHSISLDVVFCLNLLKLLFIDGLNAQFHH